MIGCKSPSPAYVTWLIHMGHVTWLIHMGHVTCLIDMGLGCWHDWLQRPESCIYDMTHWYGTCDMTQSYGTWDMTQPYGTCEMTPFQEPWMEMSHFTSKWKWVIPYPSLIEMSHETWEMTHFHEGHVKCLISMRLGWKEVISHPSGNESFHIQVYWKWVMNHVK